MKGLDLLFEFNGNRFAKQCADLMRSGHAPSTVLYLYGPHNSGKTAMLNYIEAGIYAENPEKNVVKLSSQDMQSLFYGRSSIDTFSVCGSSDYVFMDNIHLVSNDDWCMFSSLSDLIDKMEFLGKKFVLTGNRPPEQMNLPTNLFSRLKWELSAKLIPPTLDECKEALLETARNSGLSTCKEIDSIIEKITAIEGNNLGANLATLRRIAVRAELMNVPFSLSFAESVLYEGEELELIS